MTVKLYEMGTSRNYDLTYLVNNVSTSEKSGPDEKKSFLLTIWFRFICDRSVEESFPYSFTKVYEKNELFLSTF